MSSAVVHPLEGCCRQSFLSSPEHVEMHLGRGWEHTPLLMKPPGGGAGPAHAPHREWDPAPHTAAWCRVPGCSAPPLRRGVHPVGRPGNWGPGRGGSLLSLTDCRP